MPVGNLPECCPDRPEARSVALRSGFQWAASELGLPWVLEEPALPLGWVERVWPLGSASMLPPGRGMPLGEATPRMRAIPWRQHSAGSQGSESALPGELPQASGIVNRSHERTAEWYPETDSSMNVGKAPAAREDSSHDRARERGPQGPYGDSRGVGALVMSLRYTPASHGEPSYSHIIE